jgi:membrane protease subunit (stomatin/prohibitin family)
MIDVVSWDNQDPTLFAWHFPEKNLSTWTQLIVAESQEAVLFSKGQIVGKFSSGKHTLSTENLPLLRTLYTFPFQGKNPFTAEVWFVNKRMPLDVPWSISQMMVSDPSFEFIPITARGKYGFVVSSAEKFLVKLVGTITRFTSENITQQFQGVLEQNTKATIANCIISNRIPCTEYGMKLGEIASALEKQLSGFWESYGLKLTNYAVTNIEIDQSTPTGKQIIDIIAKRSSQRIAGYTWQQQQMAEIAKEAVSNSGGDMGILGMAMLTGGFGGGGNLFGQMMAPGPTTPNATYGEDQKTQGTTPPSQPCKPRIVYCSHCGKSYSSTSKFCPNCGNPYNPCPLCGADNDKTAKRCVSCGAVLQVDKETMYDGTGLICPNCKASVPSGTKFCPNCGAKI